MFPALYAILDASPAAPIDSTIVFAENLIRGGVRLIQLRAKSASSRQLHDMSQSLMAALKGSAGRAANPAGAAAGKTDGVTVIVNDRADIAAMVGAQGVHVGQEDLPVEAARGICPSPLWVGVSTHNLEQLRAADATSADYIAVGPIFQTASKQNPDPVVGLEFLRKARNLTRKPLVAIGGITVQSAGEVFRAGADSVAVIGDLRSAPDPAERARAYLEIARATLRASG